MRAARMRAGPSLAAAALVMSAQLAPAGGGVRPVHGDPQISVRPRTDAVTVTFRFTQSSPTGRVDVIVLFDDRPGPAKPGPADLGCSAATAGQRFSFSNQRFAQGLSAPLSQRASDRSFLERRFIRVVNCSSASWELTSIVMSLDGKPILREQMSQFRGSAPTRGIACASDSCRYWEADLQRLRRNTRR